MSHIYFGTRQYARWIRAYAPGATRQAVGYSEKVQYLGGGAGHRKSADSHMEYTISWPNMDRERIRAITDFASGVYGDMIHWLDPTDVSTNLLNAAWSQPAIGAVDGVPLVGKTRPRRVQNTDFSQGYPAFMAEYSITAGDSARSFYIPIPAGCKARIGAHGIADSGGLIAQPTVSGVASGSPVGIPVLGVNDSQRFTNVIDGAEQGGIDLSIDTTEDRTLTLAGIMVQVLPTLDFLEAGFGWGPFGYGAFGGEGEAYGPHATGGFISGSGHSGCRFDPLPTVTPYYLNGDGESYGLSAGLLEVAEWL